MGRGGSGEGRWGCMAGGSERMRLAGVYGVTIGITCFQISIKGREDKSIKDEAWIFGLSNRKD